MKKFALLSILMCMLAAPLFAGTPDVEPFLGRWALFLPGGAGWLEVKADDGFIDADMLWYGGSVTPVMDAYIDGETLVVTRLQRQVMKKDKDGKPIRTHQGTQLFKFMLFGDQMVGKQIEPAANGFGTKVTKFTGKKIADLPPAPNLKKIKKGAPIALLNGKDLGGWKLMGDDKSNGWSIVDGVLVNNPVQKEGEHHVSYGNLRTVDTFEDFNLKLQVNVPKGNNSGIYLRGIYEVQVYDSYGKPLDSHNMGAIYSRITPSVAAEKPAGEWQDMDITLCDRHATVILNGKTIVDNQPLKGVTGGAITACEFMPGPIYLQGDHGKVSYRNVVLTPLEK
jgi:hypothetical protein